MPENCQILGVDIRYRGIQDRDMTNTIESTSAPAIASVRKVAPGEWIVVFVDGMCYPMSGGFRDETDVRESALYHRAKNRVCEPWKAQSYTVARAESDTCYVTVADAGRFDCRDYAELVAQNLTRATGVEHASFFGRGEDYNY